MVEEILNKILYLPEPEIYLRRCIHKNDATNLDDMKLAGVCAMCPIDAKTMVEILFKGLKSNNYKTFAKTFKVFLFLLQYSTEKRYHSVFHSYPSNSEECIIATALR